MKNLFFSLFVASMFILASCGGPSAEEQKRLEDSLVNALNQAFDEMNSALEEMETTFEDEEILNEEFEVEESVE